MTPENRVREGNGSTQNRRYTLCLQKTGQDRTGQDGKYVCMLFAFLRDGKKIKKMAVLVVIREGNNRSTWVDRDSRDEK